MIYMNYCNGRSEIERELVHALLQFTRPLLLRAAIQFELSLLGHKSIKCFELIREHLNFGPEC